MFASRAQAKAVQNHIQSGDNNETTSSKWLISVNCVTDNVTVIFLVISALAELIDTAIYYYYH